MTTSDDRFKIAQFNAGYLAALQDVFQKLSEMHHKPKDFYDRKEIDTLWDHIKDLEDRARRSSH